jgi:drug/metabolite transporter (DMT)-like permease
MNDPTIPRRMDAAGVAAAVFCCFLWGGNAVAVKFAIPGLPPFGCAAIRFLLALPLLALICRGAGQAFWVRRSLWGLLGLHAALTAIQIGTFNWGTSHSEAGRSSVFINIHPLVVAPLAWLLLGERLGARGVLGLASAVGGVVVLLAEPLRRGGGLAGDLVVLGSGVVFGFQTIAQKKTFPHIPPVTLLFAQTVLAVPLTLAYSLGFEGIGQYQLTRVAFWGVLYQGLAVSGLCFTIWIVLLRRYPAGRLATLAFMTPLFGVGLGHLLRGETLTWPVLLGGGLVGLGIYLVASDRTAHRAEPDIALPGEDAP